MESSDTLLAARGLTDAQDRLLSADEPLADLHARCGGAMPGVLAIPELLDLVRQGRTFGLRLAREFTAFDGEDVVTGFVRIHPLPGDAGGGCELLIENWHRREAVAEDESEIAARMDGVDRATAEVVIRLDRKQNVQFLSVLASDANALKEAARENTNRSWTQFIELDGVGHHQPLHWRLLDGASCTVPGSERSWRARLLPLGPSTEAPRGFELLLIADQPLVSEMYQDTKSDDAEHMRLIGSALTPALRQPIARVVANAETIKAKLAGPLRDEYAEYAGNISSAGQHLNAMLEDLADLEVVEAEGFSTAREKVDLADAARRAAGILGVRAQTRGISVKLPDETSRVVAVGEFRRVLQVLINLIGNAIAYSPEGSDVLVDVSQQTSDGANIASITVSDRGPGVSGEQAERIFAKFERLGRENDGGSGLGLYISRRLALVMGGDLTLDSDPGEGARFTLSLPSVN
ncbi:MAG: ATP-binding protein [Pseudomonadota bacterium]